MDKKTLLYIFGTRPEAIKLAPLIHQSIQEEIWDVRTCVTAQHRQLLDSVLNFFDIVPDFDLNLMSTNQSLVSLTQRCLGELEPILANVNPDLVLIQGDTTSAFVGALNAFYHKVPVAHVESGLRSYNRYSPFPEDMNRQMISKLSDLHFCPTEPAFDNLIKEGVSQNIHITGNTVVDALQLGLEKLSASDVLISDEVKEVVQSTKNYVLVTCHRRESFGEAFESIVNGLIQVTQYYGDDIQLILPVHPNPYVINTTKKYLSEYPNIHLIPAVDYPNMLYLLKHCMLVLTDSGGLQEEAPSLKKPVLVIRDVTERVEGIEAGTSVLVGTEANAIFENVRKVLEDPSFYRSFFQAKNPYGDGDASQKILSVLHSYFSIPTSVQNPLF